MNMNLGERIIALLCASLFLSWQGAWSLVVSTTAPSSNDLDIVTRQLGYRPTNYVCVSARKKNGEPIAIQTYPLEGGARRRQKKAQQSAGDDTEWLGTPFPTLYWLTCPDISKCIANLERQGFVKLLEQELRENPKMAANLMRAHNDYAARRWESLSPDHQGQLTSLSECSTTMQRMRDMLQYSGIAGSNLTTTTVAGSTTPPPAIKCLHTHYAHYRSACGNDESIIANPVGARVHQILLDEYPDLLL